MYFNVNFNVLFKLIKVHLLVSELNIHQNARSNDKNQNIHFMLNSIYFILKYVPFMKEFGEKNGKAGQVTNDNTTHAFCMPGT